VTVAPPAPASPGAQRRPGFEVSLLLPDSARVDATAYDDGPTAPASPADRSSVSGPGPG
jgi:hypothetical protein